MEYVFVAEAELEREVLPFVESALGAREVDLPVSEVVVGQHHFELLICFLDRLVLLLEPLAHALGHR